MNIKHIFAHTIINVLAINAAFATNCTETQSTGKVINACNKELVFAYCGLNPKYGTDCEKQRFGVAGVQPGRVITDANDYSQLYFSWCDSGGVPSNLRWDRKGISATCP